FAGLHSHIGSQIFDTAGFEVAARRVIELAARIHGEHGVHVEELDLGGGFGIAYTPDDDPPEVKSLTSSLRAIVAFQCSAVMLSRVVGRHCERGDIVVRDCYLPADLAPGDLLAVAATGAYCRSMASNYNHLTKPGVVAVRDGAAVEIVRRETLDDLLRLDVG